MRWLAIAVLASSATAHGQQATGSSVEIVTEEQVGPAKNDIEFHGYARMPLNLEPTPREPFLVDSDYFLSGFAYTRLYEPDWSELFLSAHYENYRVQFGLFASLYSDYASPELENQFGIAQASVAVDKFLGRKELSVEAGVFWDLLGYFEPYDTYLFGRTHQGGVKARWRFENGAFIQGGAGVHQAILQQNVGLTPVMHLVARAPVGRFTFGGYGVRSWTRDKRQLSPIENGDLRVLGVDATAELPWNLGKVYVGGAHYKAERILFLAPAVELLHSRGGRGLAENYLGVEDSDNGTGAMWTGAFDYRAFYTKRLGMRAFGMVTHVNSKQATDMPRSNRDDRTYLKWGVEPSFDVFEGVRASLRYDRVILDMDDQENGFRALSPRLTFPMLEWGELRFQYSRYFYGDKVQLRPGQVPLEMDPDENAFSLQASARW